MQWQNIFSYQRTVSVAFDPGTNNKTTHFLVIDKFLTLLKIRPDPDNFGSQPVLFILMHFYTFRNLNNTVELTLVSHKGGFRVWIQVGSAVWTKQSEFRLHTKASNFSQRTSAASQGWCKVTGNGTVYTQWGLNKPHERVF